MLIITLLFAGASGNLLFCPKERPRLQENFSDVPLKQCIAHCLDLIEPTRLASQGKKSSCYYDRATAQGCGKVSDMNSNKVVICDSEPPSFGSSDELTRLCDIIYYDIFQFNSTSDVVWAKADASSVMVKANNLRKVGVKAIGSFHIWETAENFMRISASTNLRAKMAASIMDVVEQVQLDGLYLKWHWPGCPMGDQCKAANLHKNYTIELISAISKPLKSAGKLFLLKTSFDPLVSFMIDDYFSQITPHVDFFVLDTSNLNGHWNPKPDLNFNLKVTSYQVKNLITKVKNPGFAKKLVATFILDMLSFELKTPTKDNKLYSVEIKSNVKHLKYLRLNEWCKLSRPGSGYAVFNNTETQNYAVKEDHLFVFDNVLSLKAKMEWVSAIGIAGVNFVAVVADDQQNECGCGRMPFMRTVTQLLKSKDCDPRPCF